MGESGRVPGVRVWLAATALYLVAWAAATYPVVTHLGSALPSALPDPLMHLWVMRWYKDCLLHGRLPVYCPAIQYPVGAPLGLFSPMHLEGLLYLPLSLATSNDVLCYNLLWMIGFVSAGLGTFALAWWVVRDVPCAWLAGLLAMLAGPMTVHAHAHLELIYVGPFPVFLLAWLRFLDRPSWRRMAVAAGLYVLLAMGAAYFLVLAIPPAALAVAWEAARRRREGWGWLKARMPWLAGFSALAAAPLAALFAGQVWAMAAGFSLRREFSQFVQNSAPWWSYAAPTPAHPLGRLLPRDPYAAAGIGPHLIECASYLGLVTLGLLLIAATRRASLPRRGFWWATLGLLVVLSLGPILRVGSVKLPLPAAVLWKLVPVFRLTRNPARWNLLAIGVAAVLAAAGLRHLIGRLRAPARLAAVAALAALAVADLRVVTLAGSPLPAMPSVYRDLATRGDRPALLEIPLICSGAPWHLTAACGYWQSLHGARTSAGYSGNDNESFDDRVYHVAPFHALRLAEPGFLADPEHVDLDVVRDVRFDDYAWLFLAVHRFDAIVLHQWPGAVPEVAVRLDRLKRQLRPALVAEDAATALYDPRRLPPPTRPVVMRTEGWAHAAPLGSAWRGRACPAAARVAGLALYNPDPDRPLRLTIEAEGFRRPREVRLRADGRELARWTIRPGALATYTSPPFSLPAGLHALTLASDGAERPRHPGQMIAEGDPRPYSLRVAALRLEFEPGPIAARSSPARR